MDAWKAELGTPNRSDEELVGRGRGPGTAARMPR